MRVQATLTHLNAGAQLLLMKSLVAVAVAIVLVGCGGDVQPPPTSPVTDRSEATPGERCLAAAAAARTRPDNAPETIEVAHILVRHDALPRDQAPRSREEACLKALEARKRLEAGDDFEAVVQEFSDEKSRSTTFGNLGTVRADDVNPRFADAAFALEVNGLSYVVETKAGFHVIVRTE